MPCWSSAEILGEPLTSPLLYILPEPCPLHSGAAELVLPFLLHGQVLENSPSPSPRQIQRLNSLPTSIVCYPMANEHLSPLHTDSELICVLQEDDIHVGR